VEVKDVLKRLSDGAKNEVWVLSGLTVGVLDRLEGVGVVAENGCFIRTRRGEWIDMVANFNLSWKAACLEILNYFTERTPGSIIEERDASMVWRYWTADAASSSSSSDDADRQWARRQAAEAQNHIFDSLGERYGLRIIPGKNSFLVLPTNISRSTAVGAILNPGGPLSASPTVPLSNAARRSSTSSSSKTTPSSSPLSKSFTKLAGMKPWMPVALEDKEGGWGAAAGGSGEVDFMMVVSADERLLRRVDEWEGAETVSVREEGVGRGTDARWRVAPGEVGSVLEAFVGV